MIDIQNIHEAAKRLAPYLLPTPLVQLHTLELSSRFKVSLKLESLQPTGAFKVRGAFNALSSLNEAERTRGVVAVGGGNHPRAIAYAAHQLGLSAVVCMAQATPESNKRFCQHYGARVELTSSRPQAYERASEIAELEGRTLVHPYANPRVMAGQGTIGLEILLQAPDVTDIFVSVGGGALLSGITVAVKTLHPEVRIWAVETQGTNTLERSLAAGVPVNLPIVESIAWSLGAPTVTPFALELAQQHIAGLEVVSDEETKVALKKLLEDGKLLVEPAASCTLAALHRKQSFLPEDAHAVLVMCSGNVSLEQVQQWLL